MCLNHQTKNPLALDSIGISIARCDGRQHNAYRNGSCKFCNCCHEQWIMMVLAAASPKNYLREGKNKIYVKAGKTRSMRRQNRPDLLLGDGLNSKQVNPLLGDK
jgi:hypothetical protein